MLSKSFLFSKLSLLTLGEDELLALDCGGGGGGNGSDEFKAYSAFPRAKPGTLTIHTDTCVALKVNKGHVVICSSDDNDDDEAASSGRGFVFIAQVDELSLKTVVGLEKDPEICLLALAIRDGKVLFGSGR